MYLFFKNNNYFKAHTNTWKPRWLTIHEVNKIAKRTSLLLKTFPLVKDKPF